MARAVIKRRGLGISPGYYERLSRLLSKENNRKIEPSCLIPRPLVVFTRQLEILVTTLSGTSNMALLFFPHPLSFPCTSSCFPVNSVGPLFVLEGFSWVLRALVSSLKMPKWINWLVVYWGVCACVYVCGQLLSIFLRNNLIILAPGLPCYFAGCVLTDILQSDHLSHVILQCPLLLKWASLQASSPFGGYHEKWTCERHTRGDAKTALLAGGFSSSLLSSPK